MIIIKTKLPRSYNGMTLWPFLFVAYSQKVSNKRFLNHENIHARQQQELALVFFYIWYGIEYLIYRSRYNHHLAYRNIVFEREAYHNEDDLQYLSRRKFLAFLRYYRKEYRYG
ncbi:MAG: hypothetical protein WBA16_07750 [Nonlabens sp.]